MLKENDLNYLSTLGINKEKVDEQIDFLTGKVKPKVLKLIRPCTHNDGILPPEEVKVINSQSSEIPTGIDISRFIPSSGSATRMFSFDNFSDNSFKDLKLLPFFSDISNFCSNNNIDLDDMLKTKNIQELKEVLLGKSMLDFSSRPKALIDFHLIDNIPVSPIEEFIINSSEDITNTKVSFSIQEDFRNQFQSKLDNSPFFQEIDSKSLCNFIVQSKSTNSICIDSKGDLLRNENGEIYTHPSGHGSLIDGLNEIDADYVFINNIDNVSPKTRGIRYSVSNSLLNIAINTKNNFDMMIQRFVERNYKLLEPSINQLENVLGSQFKDKTIEEKVDIIIEILNKPVRVCGIVKDENSKGGKPFWVYDGKSESVQIVEESQVDFNDENQKKVWNTSTYFNPVEMVCCLRDFTGNKYNLKDFSEDSLRMIVKKNIKGKDSTFIELPGLWNGSMHYWHTTFVEIPSSLFTPVKNFTDLFLPIHQP